MVKSKNTIAHQKYDGEDYEDLSPGEKAAVTRAFNAQPAGNSGGGRSGSGTGFVTATVLRIGVNGSQTCGLASGATIEDLLKQANYRIDSSKEGIVAQSTGNTVNLSDAVKNGETYAISPEIKSA